MKVSKVRSCSPGQLSLYILLLESLARVDNPFHFLFGKVGPCPIGPVLNYARSILVLCVALTSLITILYDPWSACGGLECRLI